ALADAEGIDAVTMRRVAAEVGAGVMSLYSYAPDKETLLDLMIDHVNGELSESGPLTGEWRADLKAIGHLQRDHMLRHPWLATAVPARRTLGPRTLAFLEHALAALRRRGLTGGPASYRGRGCRPADRAPGYHAPGSMGGASWGCPQHGAHPARAARTGRVQ
ncbi:TetR/AcrR family transcriptional regulator C-terminal domain-containing protein, partial [Streptomyces sp. P01-B04]|uniref:TetR/AcrR family transcriptional regulator n=1 Tax=Streptomyces poriferorum TaxID=2798799 RepID=UPI001C5E915C